MIRIPPNTKNKIAVLTPAPVFMPFVFIQVRMRIRMIAVSLTLKSAKGKKIPPMLKVANEESKGGKEMMLLKD